MPAMPDQPFQVAARAGANANVGIVSVTGPLTVATSPAFQEAARAVASPSLIVDLSEVPWLDSMAIGALVRVYASCSKAGRRLALVGLNHRVANVLRLTGVDALFDTYSSITEAESALA